MDKLIERETEEEKQCTFCWVKVAEGETHCSNCKVEAGDWHELV